LKSGYESFGDLGPESPKEAFREALDWLDLYLGPVH